MEFRNNFQELKSQIEYLSSLNKEDIIHIIKSSIYELESLNFLNDEELNEINKVTLISEPFNNLFFKYNKERLINKGVVYICLLYTSPSPRDRNVSRMPSSA